MSLCLKVKEKTVLAYLLKIPEAVDIAAVCGLEFPSPNIIGISKVIMSDGMIFSFEYSAMIIMSDIESPNQIWNFMSESMQELHRGTSLP